MILGAHVHKCMYVICMCMYCMIYMYVCVQYVHLYITHPYSMSPPNQIHFLLNFSFISTSLNE